MKIFYFIFFKLVCTTNEGYLTRYLNLAMKYDIGLKFDNPLYILMENDYSYKFNIFMLCLLFSAMGILGPKEKKGNGKKGNGKKIIATLWGLFLFLNHMVSMYISINSAWEISLTAWFLLFFVVMFTNKEGKIQNILSSIASTYVHAYIIMIHYKFDANLYYILLILLFLFMVNLGEILPDLHLILAKSAVCTFIIAILLHYYVFFIDLKNLENCFFIGCVYDITTTWITRMCVTLLYNALICKFFFKE